MPQVPIQMGNANITATLHGKAHKIPPNLLEAPGGLYPLKSAAFEVDEYRIMAGWPVTVPDGDIRVHCMVSGDGGILGNRMEPTAQTTNADMRWVADKTLYDQVALLWRPLQGNVSPWNTSAQYAPSLLNNYEYRVKNERFVDTSVLNFDSDTKDFMWIDLSLIMGGTMGYTLLMVLSPNSVYGNNANVPSTTLWGPDNTAGAWSYFTVRDKAIWMTTDEQPAQKGVPIGDPLESSAPSYLAIVVARPTTTMYAGTGPSNITMASLTAGVAPKPLSTRFRLGWGPFTDSNTMDMALMDVSLYAGLLNKEQVLSEFSLLSQVYGGDT